MTDNRTVAIYARVSTEEQAEHGYGLPAQMEACRQKAEREDLTVVAIYEDAGVSGQTEDRAGIQAAITAAEIGQYEVLLMYHRNRLGRTRAVSANLREKFERLGIQLMYAEGGNVDPTSTAGIIVDAVGDAMSEVYVRELVKATQTGKRQSALDGNYIGGRVVPFGYKRVKIAISGTKFRSRLEVDPAEAKWVERIFERFLEGETYAEIAEYLNDKKVARHDPGQWAYDHVSVVLSDEHYISIHYQGLTRRYIKPDGTKGTRRVSKTDPSVIKVPVPEIIDKGTFAKAQVKVASISRQYARRVTYNYLLRGRVVCGECGGTYQGRTLVQKVRAGTKDYGYYYHSQSKRPVHMNCVIRDANLNLDRTDQIVKQILHAQLTIPEDEWDAHLADASDASDEIDRRLQKIRDKRTKVKADLTKARQAYLDGIFTAEEYDTDKDRILEDDADLERQEQVLSSQQEPHFYDWLDEQQPRQDLQDFRDEGVATFDIYKQDGTLNVEATFQRWFEMMDRSNVKLTVLSKDPETGAKQCMYSSRLGTEPLTINGNPLSSQPHLLDESGLYR